MPAVHLHLAWPDGRTSVLYSPSTVILEVLQPGQQITVADLGRLGSQALRRASERVRARYGFACTRAEEEERELLAWVARYSADDRVAISGSPGPGPGPAAAEAASPEEMRPDY